MSADGFSKIYVVMGSAGEYSDHREWLVAAYFDEAHAAEHVALATACGNLLMQSECKGCGNLYRNCYCPAKNPNIYDPYFGCDYIGFNYTVVEVPFRTAPPEVP